MNFHRINKPTENLVGFSARKFKSIWGWGGRVLKFSWTTYYHVQAYQHKNPGQNLVTFWPQSRIWGKNYARTIIEHFKSRRNCLRLTFRTISWQPRLGQYRLGYSSRIYRLLTFSITFSYLCHCKILICCIWIPILLHIRSKWISPLIFISIMSYQLLTSSWL